MSRPNVWAEVSLLNLFTPLQTVERIVQLLEMASTDRIMSGIDGHKQPETFWFAAQVLHEAWEQAARPARADRRQPDVACLDARRRLRRHGPVPLPPLSRGLQRGHDPPARGT